MDVNRNNADGGGEAEGAVAAQGSLAQGLTSALDAMRALLHLSFQHYVPNDVDVEEDSEEGV
jgi:hypothetical protein